MFLGGVLADWHCPLEEVKVGTGRKLRDGDDIAVLSVGPVGNNVVKAVGMMENDGDGISVAHYDMRFVKPLDENLLKEVAAKFKHVITVEDGVREGGFGSAVIEWMEDNGQHPDIVRLGLPDHFVEHGTVAQLQSIVGIDAEGIRRTIEETLRK